MADENLEEFKRRLKQIDKTYGSPKKKPTDVIIPTPIAAQKRSVIAWVPWKFMIYTFGGMLALKVLLLLEMGEGRYTARLESTQDGTMSSKIGGFIMQLDPVTLAARDRIAPVIKNARR